MAPVQPATPTQAVSAGASSLASRRRSRSASTRSSARALPRIDIPDIVTGKGVYIQNIRVPGMLHGRVVRPRGQMLFGFGAPIVSVDESSIAHLPGVKIVRKGDFLGVVAPHEFDAIQAAAQLKVKWADPPAVLPGSGNEFQGMRELDSAGKSVQTLPDRLTGNVDAALASAAHVVNATYGWPTNIHTPIGPMCAVADVTPQGARIFTGTQGVYQTRATGRARPRCAARTRSASPRRDGRLLRRRVPIPRRRPGGGAHVAGGRRSRARAADALGRDRRGTRRRRRRCSTSVPASTARATSSRFDHAHFYPQYRNEQDQTTAELVGHAAADPPRRIAAPGGRQRCTTSPTAATWLKSIPLRNNWIKAHWMRAGSGPHTHVRRRAGDR